MSQDLNHYASIIRRILATILDVLILLIPAAILGHVIPVVGWFVAWFLYAPVLESSELRGTLGKYLAGIQVTDLEGRQLSFQAALLRNLLKMISTGLCFIGHISALFTARKQAAHDLLTESLVVYGRHEMSFWEAWTKALKNVFPATPAQNDSLSRLERLQALREKGVLSEEEFLSEKRRILANG